MALRYKPKNVFIMNFQWRHRIAPGNYNLCSNIMLKFSGRLAQSFFYINGLSFFSIQHFGLTLPTLGQILTFFGANTAQIKKKIFSSQNGSHLRDFASFEPLCVKIRQRVWLLRVPQKKIKIKTTTKRYISHIYLDIPREWIVTTFGIWGGPVDLINYTNFWQSIQGFRFCMGQNSTIPIDFAVNTVLLRRTACDQSRQFFALC